MTARRSGTLAAAVVAAAAVLAVLLVTWASSIGPGGVVQGEGWQPSTAVPSDSAIDQVSADDEPPTPDEEEPRPNNAALLRFVALVLNVGAVVLALVLMVRLGRWTRTARRERRIRLAREAALDVSAFEVVGPRDAVARELLAGADEQRGLLDEGTPRNAVVACWHRFETGAAGAGLERRPWETSSEFTIRVLDLVAADTRAVSRLAELYREARFSRHELTEHDRDAARAALDEIHRTIRLPVAAPRGAPA